MKFYDIINTKTDFLTDQIKPLRENSVSLRILSEFGKIRTRRNSVFGHFLRNADARFSKSSQLQE